MITYLIHTTSIWVILFIAYRTLLSKEKYFILNRIYLLASLALGLLLPLVQFVDLSSHQVIPEVSAMYHGQVQYISQLSTSVRRIGIEATTIDWTVVFFYAISLGMALMLLRNVIAGYKISALYRNSEKLHHEEFTEVQTQKDHLPFSFFRYIFFSAFKLNDAVRTTILNHEIHHVRSKHTWDVLYVEMIKVLFWWNPIVYLYKRAITENHEYAADHAAISNGSRKDYCELLLQSNMPGVNLDLGHPFFQTYIKKRIDMMYRNKSNWKSYIKFTLPIIAIVCMAFIINEDKLELNYTLDSDFIDLFAGENLLRPDVDYTLDRINNKISIDNPKYTQKEGIKYCMFIIDEPRDASYFEEDHRKVEFTDYVSVRLTEHGILMMNEREVTIEDVFHFVNEVEADNNSKVKINLSVDGNVKNENVVLFLDKAVQLNVEVVLDEDEGYGIPSISPLAPKSIIDRDRKGSGYGLRMHPLHKVEKFHKGIDLKAKMGTPIFATADGVVSKVESKKSGYGKHVIIDHADGYQSVYAHMESFKVAENDKVELGQQIGLVGNTGVSTYPHLHYEVRRGRKAVDPVKFGVSSFDKYENKTSTKNSAEIMVGSNNLINQDVMQDSIIKLGFNINGGVIVKAGKSLLIEGQDYSLDYQLGRLKIINEDYLSNNQPITVEFTSNESEQIMDNDNGKSLVAKKFESDMTYDTDCKPNNKGVYSWADKLPNLASCSTEDHYMDYICSREILNEYVLSNLEYPESLVKMGFVGRLMYSITIDEDGNVEEYEEQLRRHKKLKLPELEAEGTRLMELIKENKKFEPAECNGEKVKGMMHMSVYFRLDDMQMKRVEIRDASNTPIAIQIATLTGISKGGLGYTYDSEMNGPYTVKITDPLGEVIYNESFDYIYKSKREGVKVPNNVNGEFKIEVTQDGKTVTSIMNCTLF